MAKKNASDLGDRGDRIVAAAREAVAVARGEMRPARVRRIPITVRKAKAAPAERERVVEMLLSSVDTSLLFEDEWAEEADRRAEEIRRGSVRPVSGPDCVARRPRPAEVDLASVSSGCQARVFDLTVDAGGLPQR